MSSSKVQIAQLQGQVIKALVAQCGDELKKYDKDGDKEIMVAAFRRTNELWDATLHMTKVTNTRNENTIIMVGHHIANTTGFSDMQQGINDTLRAVNGFIKINDWGMHLDSHSVGFLANRHPVHHNREMIKSDIVNFLNDLMCDDAYTVPLPDFKVVLSS
jgi:hypothetical protein